MSNKSTFTAEEWQVLYKAAPMAGLAVTLASPSGPFGIVKEMFAVGMTIADTFQKGSSNELVTALMADMKARGTQPERPQGIDTPEKAKEAAMANLREVNALLAAKSTPEEAAGFKQWLQDVALKVAEASNEGGFLGFGGTKVSDAEKQALTDIGKVLA